MPQSNNNNRKDMELSIGRMRVAIDAINIPPINAKSILRMKLIVILLPQLEQFHRLNDELRRVFL